MVQIIYKNKNIETWDLTALKAVSPGKPAAQDSKGNWVVDFHFTSHFPIPIPQSYLHFGSR